MQQAGFAFPGHTEFLQHMAGADSEVLMLLISEGLRVGTVTGHIPLKDVADAITTERIMAKATLAAPEPVARFRRAGTTHRDPGPQPARR